MTTRIPRIHPISDFAREARRLVEEAHVSQEPIVITQRGREVAVLVPVELYRDLEARTAPRTISPRLARKEDAPRFRMTVTVDRGTEGSRAGV